MGKSKEKSKGATAEAAAPATETTNAGRVIPVRQASAEYVIGHCWREEAGDIKEALAAMRYTIECAANDTRKDPVCTVLWASGKQLVQLVKRLQEIETAMEIAHWDNGLDNAKIAVAIGSTLVPDENAEEGSE